MQLIKTSRAIPAATIRCLRRPPRAPPSPILAACLPLTHRLHIPLHCTTAAAAAATAASRAPYSSFAALLTPKAASAAAVAGAAVARE